MQWLVKVGSSRTSNDGLHLSWSSFDSGFHCFVFCVQNFGNIALYLFSFRLNIFDGKRDDRSTYLYSHGVMGFQAKLIFQQDDGSELGRVIFDVKTIMFAFYNCMASGNTDIIDSHLRFMTSTKFKLSLFWCDSQQMNISTGILVQRHGF